MRVRFRISHHEALQVGRLAGGLIQLAIALEHNGRVVDRNVGVTKEPARHAKVGRPRIAVTHRLGVMFGDNGVGLWRALIEIRRALTHPMQIKMVEPNAGSAR